MGFQVPTWKYACLKFGKTKKGLVGYVDSDFAADLDKRRSLQVMCSPLVVVLLVGRQHFSRLLPNPPRRLNTWLLLK